MHFECKARFRMVTAKRAPRKRNPDMGQLEPHPQLPAQRDRVSIG
jgi:hypothetical protein